MPDNQFFLDNLYNTPREKFDLNSLVPSQEQSLNQPNVVPSSVDALIGPAKKVSPFHAESRPISELNNPRYGVIIPNLDMEDIYGSGQSAWAKAINGITKGLSLAATTFTQTTIGSVTGLFSWLNTGDFTSFYNNDFNKWLDSLNKDLENKLPNYYTNVETNAEWYSPKNLFTANFIFDKLIKNTGFAVGAMASGYAVGWGLKALGAASKATALGKGIDALRIAEQSTAAGESIGTTYSNLAKFTNQLGGIDNILDKGYRAVTSGLATAGEAGIEAMGAINEHRDALIAQYTQDNGVAPTGAALEQINQDAERVGDTVFKLNTALLSASNYVMLPKVLGSRYALEKNGLNETLRGIKREGIDNFAVNLPSTRFGKALYKTRNVGSLFISPTESFEEASQYAFSTGVQNYYNKKYKGESVNFFTDAIIEGYKNVLSDKEGMESVLLGALTGGLMTAPGSVKRRGFTGYGGTSMSNTTNLVNSLNNSKFRSFTKDLSASVNRASVLQEERNAAIRQGDVLEAKDLETDYTLNYLTTRIKHGRVDLIKEDLNTYRTLSQSDEGFIQLQEEGIALKDETKESFLQRIENLEELANNVNILYKALNNSYKGVLNEEGEPKYKDEVIDKLVYASAKIFDYSKRIPKLQNNLNKFSVLTTEFLEELNNENKVSSENVSAVLNNINELKEIKTTKDNLKQELQDLIELNLRRNAFIEEYDKIESDPEKYQDPDQEQPTVVKDEEGNKTELVTGKDYFTEDAFAVNEGKIVLQPRVNILNKTLEDEFQIIDPFDQTTFVSKKDLNNLRLKEEAPTTQAFENALDRVLANTKIEELPETLEEKVELFNSMEKSPIEELEQEYQKEIEFEKELAKRSKFFEEINKEIKNQKPNPTSIIDDDQEFDPISRKPLNILFNSTTYSSKDPKDYTKRQQAFLTNFKRFPRRLRKNLKVIIVTPNNEEGLGLSGLTKYLLTDTAIPKDDAQQSPIVVVAVEQVKNDLYFVDASGKRIGKVKEQVNIDEAIFATLPTKDLNWRDSEFIEEERFSKATPEQAVKLATEWEKRREEIFKWTGDKTEIYDFGITAGFAIKNPKNEDGTVPRSFITKSLIDNNKAGNQGLIRISDAFIRTTYNEYAVPSGRPYFVYGEEIQHLYNRKLTKQEANIAFDILKYLSATYKFDRKVMSFLNGLIYFDGVSEEGPLSNQIYLTPTGQLGFSDKFSVAFTPKSLEANKKKIKEFFENTYNNISSSLLKKDEVFEEIVKVNPDGSFETRVWENYQKYLISDTYDLIREDKHPSKGKQRKITDVPLTTTVRELSEDVPFDSNYEQKSFVVTNTADGTSLLNIKIEKKKEEKKAPPKADKKEEKKPTAEEGNRAVYSLNYKSKLKPDVKYTIPYTVVKENGNLTIDVPIKDSLLKGFLRIISEEEFNDFKKLLEDKAGKPLDVSNEELIKPYLKYVVTKDYVNNVKKATVKPTETQEKEIEEKTEAAPKVEIAPEDRDDFGEGDFRVITSDRDFVMQNLEKEAKVVNKLLPQVSINRLENIINTTSGGFAWGMFKRGAIYIYEKAETGTLYHEAFEAVWNMFTSVKEREQLRKEFRNRKGSFTDRETNKKVKYSSATNSQIKEQLAEEFRDYLLVNEDVILTKKNDNAIIRFFKDLFNFIKGLFTNSSKIDNLFQKIGAGNYATSPVTSSFEEHYRSVKIGDLSVSDSYKVVKGTIAGLFQKFLSSNKSLVDLDNFVVPFDTYYAQVKQDYKKYFEQTLPKVLSEHKAQLKQFSFLWNELDNNWDQVVSLTNEHLRTFGIKVEQQKLTKEQIEELIPENLQDENTLEDKEALESNYEGSSNPDSYLVDVFTLDVVKNSSAAIKTLFNTLAETEKHNGKYYNKLDHATQMAQLINFSKVFNLVMAELSTVTSPEEKYDKLEQLRSKDPVFARLFNRLQLHKSDNDISYEDWILRVKFYNIFSKQNPEGLVAFTDGNAVNIEPSNVNSSVSLLIDSWISSWKIENNPIIKITANGEYALDPTVLNKFTLRGLEERFAFLKALNIDFTKEMYDNLSNEDRDVFNTRVYNLLRTLKSKVNTVNINPKTLDSTGSFNNIAKLYLKAKADSFESTYFDINGNRRQQFILSNSINDWITEINNSESLTELKQRLPHFTNIISQNSLVLDRLFDKDGNKKQSKQLKVKYIQGEVKSGEVVPTERLQLSDRVLLDINSNLQGDYSVLVPADSKPEWMVNIGNAFSLTDFDNSLILDRIYNVFSDYYEAEREAYKNNPSIKGILSSIDSDYSTELDKEKLRTYILDYSKDLSNFLLDNNVVTKTRQRKYKFAKINSNFKKENKLKNTLSEADFNKIITMLTVNYMSANIEMHKLFFGDISQIKDPLKRYKSFVSPRESTYHSDLTFNNVMNEKFNEGLSPNDPGYWKFKEYIPTVTIEDIESYEESVADDQKLDPTTRAPYQNVNGADAQSWMTGAAYRELLVRSGRITPGKNELIDYLLASDRLLLAEDFPDTYGYQNSELKERDEALVAKGKPRGETLSILKPIGSGYTTDNNLFLDKTSVAPLFYTWTRGKNISKLYTKMLDQGIGYAIVESGRKIGSRIKNKIYDSKGNVNKERFDDIINIPYKYYGIQVETQGTKDKNTLGTQTSKDIYLNLFDAGVPKDYEGSQEWKSLNKKDKINESKIFELVDFNRNIIEEIQNVGYEELLTKFDIIDDGTKFIINDKTKLLDFIKSELFRREAPENIKNIFELDSNNELTVPIEATSVYQQVKNILYSSVDKLISRPKLNGGPKIQLSGSLFEQSRDIKKVNGKSYLKSSDLSFYKMDYRKNKVNVMEVMLPNWFAKQLRAAGSKKTDQEILDYLNNTPEGQRILTGVGFRIPTQELNSIDVFKVKEFLPEEMGDVVVVPEALTVKSGSDFDVDKLNTYLKNVIINRKGFPELIKFYNIDMNNEKLLTNFYQENLLDKYQKQQKGQKQRKTEEAIDKLFSAILDEESDLTTYNKVKVVPSLEDFIREFKGGDVFSMNRKYNRFNYKKVLENAYFESIEEIVLLPMNYKNLIKPNSNKQLKGYYEDLVGVAPKEFKSSGDESVLNRLYMNFMRNAFISGKQGVGIAAVRQTNNALSQLGEVYIDLRRWKNIAPYLSDFIRPQVGILLDHNTVEIDGTKYPTFSKSTDVNGQEASNVISQFIDSYVDIAKDPFIIQIGANTNLASTFLTMVGLGVDLKTTVYFMNQPIIREYLKYLSKNGQTFLFNTDRIKRFFSEYGFMSESITSNKVKINKDTLLDTIKKYYKNNKGVENLTEDELFEQTTIFQQFMQFAVIADNMRTVVQGTTYDTDISADPNMNTRKEYFTSKALNNTLFSGVSDIFNNSFIGNQRRLSTLTSATIAEPVFKLSHPQVKEVTDPLIDQLVSKKGMTKDNFIKYANQVDAALLSYLIQTKYNLTNKIEKLFVDEQQALAKRIIQAKRILKKKPNSDILNNIIFQRLATFVKNKKSEVKNVMLVYKPSDSFTSDVYTEAFRELRDNPDTSNLYYDLIRVSFLQSGVQKSPFSFLEYLPSEDFSTMVKPVVDNILSFDQLKEFHELQAFYRNNWNNTDLVPLMKEQFRVMGNADDPNSYLRANHVKAKWFTNLKNSKGIKQSLYEPIKIHANKSEARSSVILFEKWSVIQDYVLYNMSRTDAAGREINPEVSTKKILMQRLEDNEGNPIIYPVKTTYGVQDYYMYFPINAWGDSFRLQEYYTTPRASKVDNRTEKIDEIPMKQIREAYFGEDEVYDETNNNLDNSEKSDTFVNSISDFTNHSGGAVGADTAWDIIGKKYGLVNNNHYYAGKKTPNGNVEITKEQLEEGWQKVLEANKTLKRSPEKYKNLLSRNWMQVKNAEAVYAIATLKSTKEVNGGTGWAVQMAIDSKKLVYVFDQAKNQWFTYDFDKSKFIETVVPTLTKNFAGIGTRELNKLGNNAIKEVYENTLNRGTKEISNQKTLFDNKNTLGIEPGDC